MGTYLPDNILNVELESRRRVVSIWYDEATSRKISIVGEFVLPQSAKYSYLPTISPIIEMLAYPTSAYFVI